MQSNYSSVRTLPKDLGAFRTLVAGWEQVETQNRSPSFLPLSSSSLYLSESTNNLPQYVTSPTTTSAVKSSSALKEQFLRESSPTQAISQTNASNVTPTTPTYGTNYRFAGVERLAQRQKIYDSPNSPESRKENLSLNTRRDLLNSVDNTATHSTHSTHSQPLNQSSTAAKDIYLSRTERERDRDRAKNMVISGKTDDMVRPSLTKEPSTDVFVGFSDLPNQIHRRTVKKGFEFTLMVVGESGLGKSTLVNSMFLTDIYSNEYPGPSTRATKTVEVETTKVLLKEKTVNLHLTIVDTPGFGGAVDNSNCWQPIINYIENRYEDYLNAETRVHRTHIQDNRVHCCLYFIYPSGHSLKPIDVEFMLHLHDKVNIIPVIAKADTMTPEECLQFKRNVLNEISQNKIKIYEFPDSEDDEESKIKKELKARIPFAVIGSNYVVESRGERKRGRKYPWGLVEIENLEHCDFTALRNLLIRYYMLDLVDTSNNVHYENYRCRKLTGIGPDNKKSMKDANKNPLAQMEEEKKEHEIKMRKMETEMEQVFEMKVNEKINKLKDSESDLERRNEEMNKKLEQQRLELEEKRTTFEKEKAAFEMVSKDMEEMRRVNSLDANILSFDGKIKEKKKKGLF